MKVHFLRMRPLGRYTSMMQLLASAFSRLQGTPCVYVSLGMAAWICGQFQSNGTNVAQTCLQSLLEDRTAEQEAQQR